MGGRGQAGKNAGKVQQVIAKIEKVLGE